MKKFLAKIFLITLILIGFGNIFQVNAYNNLNCNSINKEITQYGNYKYKIDNLFRKLSTQNEIIKNKYYKKISRLTDKYLEKIDKNKQKKIYTILGYIKCENEKLVTKEVSCKEVVNIDEENQYGKIKQVYFSDNKKEIIISLGKYDLINLKSYYYYIYKNEKGIMEQTVFSNTYQNKKLMNDAILSHGIELGFANGKDKYLVYYSGNKSILEFKNKKYIFSGSINSFKNNFLFSGKKEKLLYFDGTFSKEYDVIFNSKILENGDKILIIGKGKIKRADGMLEEFYGEYFLVKNGVETKIDNVEYFTNLVTCKNKFGYIYSNKNGGQKFIFGGKNYGENKKTRTFNFYGFKENTCEPIFVQILDDGKGDFGENRLYIGNKFTYKSDLNIGEPKINGNDIYFKVFENSNTSNRGYKLYKNGKKIENRGWLYDYGFLENGKLIYATSYNGNIIIKEGNKEKIIEGIKWVDKLFISKDGKNYYLILRGDNKKIVYANGKIFKNKSWPVGAYFIKNDLFIVYTNPSKQENYLYKNNELIETFKGNPNTIKIGTDENVLGFNLHNKVLECK